MQVQQLGRTHRSNQAQPPRYLLVCTDISGESRFASAVARRLEQLGALTHGDRHAASASDVLAAFNIQTTSVVKLFRVLIATMLCYLLMEVIIVCMHIVHQLNHHLSTTISLPHYLASNSTGFYLATLQPCFARPPIVHLFGDPQAWQARFSQDVQDLERDAPLPGAHHAPMDPRRTGGPGSGSLHSGICAPTHGDDEGE